MYIYIIHINIRLVQPNYSKASMKFIISNFKIFLYGNVFTHYEVEPLL